MVVQGRDWDRVTPRDGCGFTLFLTVTKKLRSAERTASAATAGAVNYITRKPYLNDQYAPATVRHGNAVIRTFYEFWRDRGQGPLLNPFPTVKDRPNAHHMSLNGFASDRLRYNPKVPQRYPRTVPDDRWTELFATLRCHRDRALLSLAVDNGARASELLGVRQVDVDWGDQLIRVIRKGSRAEQWLPVSAEALVWLRLYLTQVPALAPDAGIWVTVRRRDRGGGLIHQPLSYEALRAMFRRVNTRLGTNWSMHDLRHTAALRMSRDKELTLRDVQTILGHRHLETTARSYLYETDLEVARRVLQHLNDRPVPTSDTPVGNAAYATEDLDVLFGKGAS